MPRSCGAAKIVEVMQQSTTVLIVNKSPLHDGPSYYRRMVKKSRNNIAMPRSYGAAKVVGEKIRSFNNQPQY